MTRLFHNIRFHDWRQFETIDIPLDNQITVITGPNGCGKTTILNTLSRHFGWNINLVSTPFLSGRQRERIWSEFGREWLDTQHIHAPPMREIGSIAYSTGENSTGEKCVLCVPQDASRKPQYALKYHGQHPVHGLNIPSHQPAINYQRATEIPTDPKGSQRHFQEFQELLLQSYVSNRTKHPGLVLKQSLIALAAFGHGNEFMVSNPEYSDIFNDFQEVLRRLLPPDIGFQRLEIRMPDVVLITRSGDFSLDAMSGGVSSLFMIAWQIQLFGSNIQGPCTVVLDEPENHLHPSMQRTLLPNLAASFPEHRFIVSTHSPFIVSSDPTATVVALTFTASRRIVSQVLDEADLSASAGKVLREVLGVPTTVPVWVENKMRDILNRHNSEPDPVIRAERIFEDLKGIGINAALGDIKLRDTHK